MSLAMERLKSRVENKHVAVIGLGVSNMPVVKLLASLGAQVQTRDRNANALDEETRAQFGRAGIEAVLGDGYLDNLQADMVLRTPGLRPDTPALLEAAAAGAEITSEMELFFEECPCPIFAVTGSDGKTTTTTLICEMLTAQGFTCHKGGNIGRPLLPVLDMINPVDIAVAELSSFQLMDMRRSPDVAVITNLSPNHLDWHRDFDEYVAAKSAIFRFQHPNDRLVYNFDNAPSRALVESSPSQTLPFSQHEIPGRSMSVRDGAIWYSGVTRSIKILDLADIRLPGRHNVENYMAACAAVLDYVDVERIRKVAREFGGVEHRIEYVRTYRGARWYNDSIASSPTRAAAGLSSFEQRVVLIAGGYDKNLDYSEFGALVNERVRLLILAGATSQKIYDAVTGAENFDPDAVEIVRCDAFEAAVEAARVRAKDGDVVLLSPASASFDMFKNFEQRGCRFKELVEAFE